jgi:hypothetical protein
MDLMIPSPLMRLPALLMMPDKAQPDEILICPSRIRYHPLYCLFYIKYSD